MHALVADDIDCNGFTVQPQGAARVPPRVDEHLDDRGGGEGVGQIDIERLNESRAGAVEEELCFVWGWEAQRAHTPWSRAPIACQNACT